MSQINYGSADASSTTFLFAAATSNFFLAEALSSAAKSYFLLVTEMLAYFCPRAKNGWSTPEVIKTKICLQPIFTYKLASQKGMIFTPYLPHKNRKLP